MTILHSRSAILLVWIDEGFKGFTVDLNETNEQAPGNDNDNSNGNSAKATKAAASHL